MTRHLIYLSVPGLRPQDISDPAITPTLHAWANAGVTAKLAPSFPAVTSPVQASTWTGTTPQQHGVIANGFYYPDRPEVEFWVAKNDIVQGEQIWDVIAKTGELTSAVWHAQNIKDCAADYIITPAPIHESDGSTKLWCYEKPTGLYTQIIADLDHFPLQHYWGPLAGIQSTQWILKAAQWLIQKHDPSFHYIYIPHLDYASQKFGPNSPQAVDALKAFDAELAEFRDFVATSPAGKDAVFLVASEYAMTDVTSVIYPNRDLAGAGLLVTKSFPDGPVIDYKNSQAFAMVDHQVCHIYAKPDAVEGVVNLFKTMLGLDGIYTGADRSQVNLDHDRSGQVVLAANPDHWFAYYYWLNDKDAPTFAHTVDIHNKPGYDPVELFFDPQTKSIPLEAKLVKGSHGARIQREDQLGGLICSAANSAIEQDKTYADTDMKQMIIDLMGIR